MKPKSKGFFFSHISAIYMLIFSVLHDINVITFTYGAFVYV